MDVFLPELAKEKTALLVIDMQNDFCKPGGGHAKSGRDMTSILQMVPKLSDFRDKIKRMNVFRIFVRTIYFEYTNSPTWLLRHSLVPELCLPNSWGSEFIDELMPSSDEPIVMKNRYSAFVDTPLDLILRSKGIRNLLFTGVATNVCVESTVRDAFMKDYLTVTVEDCVASSESALHRCSLESLSKYFGYVANSKGVLKALK